MSQTLGLAQCEFTLLAGRLGPPTSNGWVGKSAAPLRVRRSLRGRGSKPAVTLHQVSSSGFTGRSLVSPRWTSLPSSCKAEGRAHRGAHPAASSEARRSAAWLTGSLTRHQEAHLILSPPWGGRQTSSDRPLKCKTCPCLSSPQALQHFTNDAVAQLSIEHWEIRVKGILREQAGYALIFSYLSLFPVPSILKTEIFLSCCSFESLQKQQQNRPILRSQNGTISWIIGCIYIARIQLHCRIKMLFHNYQCILFQSKLLEKKKVKWEPEISFPLSTKLWGFYFHGMKSHLLHFLISVLTTLVN